MRNSRPLWIVGGLAAAGVLAWLLFARGVSDGPVQPEPDVRESPHRELGTPAVKPGPAPALPERAPEPEHLDHHDDTGPEQLAETLPELPEPPTEDEILARPERQPVTPEEQRAQRQASIDLLDRHIERLEAEQKAAEASGDTRTADRNRIRVARMRERRAALAAEQAAGSPSP